MESGDIFIFITARKAGRIADINSIPYMHISYLFLKYVLDGLICIHYIEPSQQTSTRVINRILREYCRYPDFSVILS
jgi:hypothetical protein